MKLEEYSKMTHKCPSCLKECSYNKKLTIEMHINEVQLPPITFCSNECLKAYIDCSQKGRFPEYFDIEKAKYDEDEEFLKKYKKMYWKGYKIGNLFERKSTGSIKTPLKQLDISKEKSTKYTIPLITMTKFNNGIGGYLEDINNVNKNKVKSYLTFVQGTDGCSGICFYQKDYFVSNGVSSLENKTSTKFTDNSYEFLAKYLTMLYHNKFHNFARSVACGNDFDREIILLPIIQNDQGNEEIFTDAMTYLYLKSMILKQDKKFKTITTKLKN